ITVATALPILLGQNIGKCVPVVLASIGNNKDAKRASMCYFLFNVFSLLLFGIGVYGLDAIFDFAAMDNVVSRGGIATMHTGINVVAALLLMPFVKQYDRLLHRLIKDSGDVKEKRTLDCLDDAFLKNPQVAMEQCRKVLFDMCHVVKENVAIVSDMVLNGYNEKALMDMKVGEEFLDKSEAGINAYMVNVTYHTMTEEDSHLSTEILQSVSDLERIGDYCVNLSETAEYMFENKGSFTSEAKAELVVLFDAVRNVIDLMVEAYTTNDPERIAYVEPMEEVIDDIVDRMKSNHIMRLRNGACTADNGITFTEILTNTERISDHCSNIAIYLMQKLTVNKSFDRKEYQDELHKGVDPRYRKYIDMYKKEYLDRIQCERGMREAEGI
ncbi:MAG: Na/Pi symporter, partial [Lachnospiraceae bacterium]|nr:Na/Pi symporter [Lachnospiraceae bacterium]